MISKVCLKPTVVLAFFLGFASLALAQTANVQSRITQPIEEGNTVVLRGNTHPLATARFDQGAAPDSLPMNRMLLVLQHTPDQEAAIRQLVAEQQDRTSPNFHNWLTPQQYGQTFGPSDADIQKITSWLQSHGFEVANVSQGRHFIEFSGTAGQVQSTFHTAIHQYSVKGENHWANASDPSIPAALASVVVGVKSLHNFYAKPTSHYTGIYRKPSGAGKMTQISGPKFTFTDNGETFFAVGPADFATIYNVQPLWNAGIDGTGQSIAIVQETDINIQDIRNFRSVFNLPPSDPIIIHDGPAPGINGAESEAVIDVSWSGAVAKGATIKMVTAAGTNTTEGIALSALHIVDNNTAPILSMSFGQCELHLGTAGNQFWNSVWQQAAAEGISAFVSAGDGGSAGCDNFDTAEAAKDGLAISGDASTPFNIAVGGTDFIGDFLNPTQFWSATNDPTTFESALSYIPESPWNNTCTNPLFSLIGGGTDPIAFCNTAFGEEFLGIVGGSGGASSCISSDGHNLSTCTGGYAKPPWQTGVGVPNDGARDIPDVSLLAANGFLGSFYLVCEADLSVDGTCDLNAAPFRDFAGFGGTSVSSPAFAGILALVNQKTSARQGNANFVLYKLAAGENLANCDSDGATLPAAACIFNDVTFGSNSVPCFAGTPNCTTENSSQQLGVLPGFNSTTGYDLTTGLGSVNAANLVNNWQSITFTPTVTLLKLFPQIIIHGHGANAAVAVIAKHGTPTGQVALKTDHTNEAGDLTLGPNGTVDTVTHLLPGGVSILRARYFGDGTFGRSDSNPVQIVVLPELSTTTTSFFTLNLNTGATPPFSSGPYGSLLFVRADVAGRSGFGFASGSVTFTDNGKGLPGGSVLRLNSEGNTENPNSIDTFSVGKHFIEAVYSGDESFLPSIAPIAKFTITQAPTQTAVASSVPSAAAGTTITLTATVSTTSFGNPPTGKVVFSILGKKLGAVVVTGSTDPNSGLASATASISVSSLPVGTDAITATYDGDANYVGSSGNTSVGITAASN